MNTIINPIFYKGEQKPNPTKLLIQGVLQYVFLYLE